MLLFPSVVCHRERRRPADGIYLHYHLHYWFDVIFFNYIIMKKYLLLLAIIGFGVAMLCSIGFGVSYGGESTSSEESKGISEEEKKELLENCNYKKACELKEFSTAYEIVDKLKEETDRIKYVYSHQPILCDNTQKKSDEAERYVILQESLYLLESEGTNSLMRIVGIGKEHNAEGWLYRELLDVAKKIGDTDLVNGIENIIQLNKAHQAGYGISDTITPLH